MYIDPGILIIIKSSFVVLDASWQFYIDYLQEFICRVGCIMAVLYWLFTRVHLSCWMHHGSFILIIYKSSFVVLDTSWQFYIVYKKEFICRVGCIMAVLYCLLKRVHLSGWMHHGSFILFIKKSSFVVFDPSWQFYIDYLQEFICRVWCIMAVLYWLLTRVHLSCLMHHGSFILFIKKSSFVVFDASWQFYIDY